MPVPSIPKLGVTPPPPPPQVVQATGAQPVKPPKKMIPKLDKDGKPVLDKDGKPVMVEEAPEIMPHITFWQKEWVQEVLPFISSLALHLMLFLIAYIFYQAAIKIIELSKPPPPAFTEFNDSKDVFDMNAMLGSKNGIAGADGPLNDAFPKITEDEKWLQPKDGNGKPAKLAGGGSGDAETADAMAMSIGPVSLGKGKNGFGRGIGEEVGDGYGKGLPFGYKNGVDGGTSIFRPPPKGSAGGFRLVAFVCDASGSMMQAGKFDMLRVEIEKAVGSLSPIHGFNVVLFQEKNCKILNSGGLLSGTPENKKKTAAFLDDIMPQGATNCLPALEAAFKQGPELIFLLTDGDFENPSNEEVVAWIRSHNTKKVHICTIAFVDKGETYEKVLRQIASENGGTYKFVSQGDMKTQNEGTTTGDGK